VEFAGPAAYFVQAAASDADAICGEFLKPGAIRCGPAAVDTARLECGTPLFGIDVTDDNLPQEVNRDALAISFTKGCYLGQETVARIDAVGHVNRLLVGLRFSGSAIPAAGAPLLATGQPIGHVTSAAWSPRLNAPLALAYVRRNSAKPGTQLSSDSASAEVIQLPLP
jgi:folate-binding protein YgfZ